jgi:hypothetical protein
MIEKVRDRLIPSQFSTKKPRIATGQEELLEEIWIPQASGMT